MMRWWCIAMVALWDPPARYCIRVDLVKPEFLVEIGSVAYLSS